MRYIKLFEAFERPYIDRRAMASRKPVEIGYIKQPVEIRINIEKPPHAADQQWRHGLDDKITDDEIIETVELAVEQITIDLMHDEFDVYTKSDELNRFVIRNTESNLNVVCVLEPGEWEFTLTVITVMKKDDFRTGPGQYVVEVNPKSF
jgi:hypothetical protein